MDAKQERGRLRWLWAAISIFGSILVAAAQIEPEKAISNVAGWIEKLGFIEFAEWLQTKNLDGWATMFGVLLVGVGMIFLIPILFPDRASTWETKKPKTSGSDDNQLRLSNVLIRVAECSESINDYEVGSGLTLAANNLRETAINSQVTIHGRRKRKTFSPDGQFHEIWEPISNEYWKSYNFDLAAILDDSAHLQGAETYLDEPVSPDAEAWGVYAALRIPETDLNTMWPAENRQSKNDIDLLDALNYVAFRSWYEFASEGEPADITELSSAAELIRKKALAGKLPVWGREKPTESYGLIPSEYWKYFLIDVITVDKRRAHEIRTRILRTNPPAGMKELRYLRTSRVQTDLLWPVESP